MITLRFEKLYNKDRLAQPCSVSIPLPPEALKDVDIVTVWQKGKRLPVQKKVLSWYPDGSVRFLFLRFPADLPANQAAEVECDLFGEYLVGGWKEENKESGRLQAAREYFQGKREEEGSLVKKQEQGYRIETGVLSFTVRHGSVGMLEQAEAFGSQYTEEQFSGMLLEAGDEKEKTVYAMKYREWHIVEEGPVCVVLSNQGRLEQKHGNTDFKEAADIHGEAEEGVLCEIRMTAYAGKSYVDVELRLVNAAEQVLPVRSWKLPFFVESGQGKAEPVRSCVAESNYKTKFLVSETGETVEQEITAEFLLNQNNEHMAETFYGTFFADCTTAEGGLCATVYQAHQNFPKAVQAGKKGILVNLVPEGSEPVVLQPGMAVSQNVQLYFHKAEEELQDINHQSILYQMPDQPVVPMEVYEESGLFPEIFLRKEQQAVDVECALILSADVHTRSYGMLHWGDAPDPNYTAQGRGQGNLVWTNNEYDYPHACMLQFARTGTRRFRDYCIVSGTHQRDVDICHYSRNELCKGGQWEHTKGHCMDGKIVCSHQWVEGILDCYHLTGDERFLDAALGIGENVLRLLETPDYKKTGGLSARETGWALRTLTALYQETFEKKWTTVCERIVEQFKEWSAVYGGWLAPYTDNTVIRVPFMISVAVGSLMRYYRVAPRNDIREMILAAVDDMIEHCYMDNGYFYYKELPSLQRTGTNPLVLEALAIAYELTGDRAYLNYGRKTFRMTVQNSLELGYGTTKRIAEHAVLVGTAATKRFAQMFVPVAVYYKVAAEAGILEELYRE